MILVVDDNEDSLKIISRILQTEGFEVSVERNGKDGLAAALEQLPELVIMDIMMPEMNGIEALEKLRALPQTAHIPVILLTAKSLDEDVLTGYRVGADYYMTKPFTAKQLVYGVNLVLGKTSE
ncbi:MAG: response regulator [Deltaproteobacteria bacterium]|nr:response regulator [Deltaproteobacteria bacterium]